MRTLLAIIIVLITASVTDATPMRSGEWKNRLLQFVPRDLEYEELNIVTESIYSTAKYTANVASVVRPFRFSGSIVYGDWAMLHTPELLRITDVNRPGDETFDIKLWVDRAKMIVGFWLVFYLLRKMAQKLQTVR
jgi:hypothetical protein